MKKWPLLFLGVILTSSLQAATESGESSETRAAIPSRAMHLAVGADFNSTGGNLGMGVNVTSPYYYGAVAARLSAVYSFFDGVPQYALNQATATITTIKLSLIGSGGMLGKWVRLYGGAGLSVSFPSRQISARTSLGGFGGFGFEFFLAPRHPNSLYVEIGGSAGGTAEKYAGNPAYGTGFMAIAGTRFYF